MTDGFTKMTLDGWNKDGTYNTSIAGTVFCTPRSCGKFLAEAAHAMSRHLAYDGRKTPEDKILADISKSWTTRLQQLKNEAAQTK
jgi:hypothetical protein